MPLSQSPHRAIINSLCVLSALSLPSWPGFKPESTNLGATTNISSLSKLSTQSSLVENKFRELSEREIRAEALVSKARGYGIVLDSSGAAWTGPEQPLNKRLSMRMMVPDSQNKYSRFSRFAYLGVVSHGRCGGKGKFRIGNSDIGMAVQPNNQGAIPFINCGDTSLDPKSASVEVTNYNRRDRKGPVRGKLDGGGRYFSFKKASALREFVTFDPGEEVSISLSRKQVKAHDDSLVLILESDKRQIVIEVPVKPSYSRMDVDYRAHRVVSSVLPKTEVKASIPEYLRSAAVLLPLDEMVGFPSLDRAISCSS